MYKSLVLVLFIVSLISLPPLLATSSARNERNRAVLMQEHMDKMRIKSPQRYQRMVENARGDVSDCIGCHRKKSDKKRHFRFVDPLSPEEGGD